MKPKGKSIEYPEHDKLHAIKEESQAIGDFLEWATTEKHIHLCTYEEAYTEIDDNGDREDIPEGYYIVNKTKEELLAEFFNIDLNKLEKEKQQMLKQLSKND